MEKFTTSWTCAKNCRPRDIALKLVPTPKWYYGPMKSGATIVCTDCEACSPSVFMTLDLRITAPPTASEKGLVFSWRGTGLEKNRFITIEMKDESSSAQKSKPSWLILRSSPRCA